MNQPPTPLPAMHHPQHEEVHLRDYLNVIRRRRKLFLIAFGVVLCVVVLYTFTIKPVYEASATLHVKDEKSKTGVLGELALSEVSPVDSEIEIIKARTNAEQVVKSLHLDWRLRDRVPGMSFRLLDFTSSAVKPVYKLELTSADGYKVWDEDGHLVGIGRSGIPMQGKGITLQLDDLKGKPGDTCGLVLHSFNGTVSGLQKQTKAVEVGKKTNIIRISYPDTDPELARDVVNTLVQAYLEKTVALKAEEASKTVDFVGDQLNGVRQTVDAAEKDLQAYKSKSGVMQLDTEAQTLIENVSDVEKQRAEVVIQKKQVEFALSSLKDAARRGVVYSPSVLGDNPLVAGMASKLADLVVQKRALISEYTEAAPQAKALQGQIDELQRKLQATYETALRNLDKQEGTIVQGLGVLEGRLRQLPGAERDLARLTRLAKVNADIYTFLLQKHEEARIAKASTISNIDIVDPAITPDRPIKPQKVKNLILGLLVGCMFGVGLAFFQEYLDDTIKDPEQAKRILGLPVLSVIPYLKPAEGSGTIDAVALLEPKSAGAEAFRSLRTALHFSSLDRDAKVLLVTSAFPAEGKSTVSANLGILLTQNNARVLLVDCDLRRPSLHTKFSHSKVPGLTEIISGAASLAGAIHSTGVERLDFVSAGTIPPNPAELLGSDAMRRFLEEARGQYDRIILDAAPVLAVTDTAVLSSLADQGLVVMEMERVPAKAAQRMRDILHATGMRVSGFVFNDKKNHGQAYGYDYYGYYGYGYNAYYGEEQASAKGQSWWRKLLKR